MILKNFYYGNFLKAFKLKYYKENIFYSPIAILLKVQKLIFIIKIVIIKQQNKLLSLANHKFQLLCINLA